MKGDVTLLIVASEFLSELTTQLDERTHGPEGKPAGPTPFLLSHLEAQQRMLSIALGSGLRHNNW